EIVRLSFHRSSQVFLGVCIILVLQRREAAAAVEDDGGIFLQLGVVLVLHSRRLFAVAHGIQTLCTVLLKVGKILRNIRTAHNPLPGKKGQQSQGPKVCGISGQKTLRSILHLGLVISRLVGTHQLLEGRSLHDAVGILGQKCLEGASLGGWILLLDRAHVGVVFRAAHRWSSLLSAAATGRWVLRGLGLCGNFRGSRHEARKQNRQNILFHSIAPRALGKSISSGYRPDTEPELKTSKTWMVPARHAP